jgi:hypothetical protein
MPFNVATLGGYNLPLNFEYEAEPKRRVSVVETYYADVTQIRPYYSGDTYFTFTCNMVADALKSNLDTLFQADNTVTFKDYEGSSHTVFLCEFKAKQVKGMWNISGRMKIIPT